MSHDSYDTKHARLRERIRDVLQPYHYLSEASVQVNWRGNTYFRGNTDGEAFALMALIHYYHTFWPYCSLGGAQKANNILSSIVRTWGESIIDEEIELLLEGGQVH